VGGKVLLVGEAVVLFLISDYRLPTTDY
jgi:hypothetical protein